MGKCTRRLVSAFVVGAAVLLIGLAGATTAQAQGPYPVRFFGMPGKTSGFQCLDWKVVGANQPGNTVCWALIVWYRYTWFGFNNYSWARETLGTAYFACPNYNIQHQTKIWRDTGPERLRWEAWIDPNPDPGYVQYIDGYALVNGGISRNLALAGVDPSKCT